MLSIVPNISIKLRGIVTSMYNIDYVKFSMYLHLNNLKYFKNIFKTLLHNIYYFSFLKINFKSQLYMKIDPNYLKKYFRRLFLELLFFINLRKS